MDNLYIVIPAYNEEANIETCVAEWHNVVEKHNYNGQSRLVVIDDGSKDSTYGQLCQLRHRYPLLIPLTKKNGGHGSAVLYGYRYAIKNKADYIFQTDSDGQTNPAEFETFWNYRGKYDAVIGERRVRGDGIIRKLIENIVCLLLRIIFGVKTRDANAPFRLMKSVVVKKYISELPSDFNLPNIMFTTYFLYNKERVRFIPISFKPRKTGKNSINIRKITKIGLKAIADFMKLKRKMKAQN